MTQKSESKQTNRQGRILSRCRWCRLEWFLNTPSRFVDERPRTSFHIKMKLNARTRLNWKLSPKTSASQPLQLQRNCNKSHTSVLFPLLVSDYNEHLNLMIDWAACWRCLQLELFYDARLWDQFSFWVWQRTAAAAAQAVKCFSWHRKINQNLASSLITQLNWHFIVLECPLVIHSIEVIIYELS